MKRFDHTHLNELQEGDRFYFISEGKKVYQLIKKDSYSSGRGHVKYKRSDVRMNGSRNIRKVLRNREVVFLRSTRKKQSDS